VLEHVQIVMQRHNNIKVNTVFNGEFISSDKRANKSVSTKNYELFNSFDLRMIRVAHCRAHLSIARGISGAR